ncbi:hypothetical protein GQ53DRAFT_54535 [Thozetella sp. PMI_491]|nr:hypothetical protein GQ53DRAFT_54535 [Thozetella sp. PMI_491]
MDSNKPELLYHTILTVTAPQETTSGDRISVHVLGTHATLQAAKKFAASGFHFLHYEPEDFVEYEIHQAGEPWKYGDGTMAFAKAPAGQELLIGIETTANDLGLLEDKDGAVKMPVGVDHLHYVLQTKIDYLQDRSGATQTTEIQGCYLHRDDAISAAYACLAEDQNEFVQYDRQDSADMKGQWPFGEDTYIHGVTSTGQNITVALRTIPGAHETHAKRRHSALEE